MRSLVPEPAQQYSPAAAGAARCGAGQELHLLSREQQQPPQERLAGQLEKRQQEPMEWQQRQQPDEVVLL